MKATIEKDEGSFAFLSLLFLLCPDHAGHVNPNRTTGVTKEEAQMM